MDRTMDEIAEEKGRPTETVGTQTDSIEDWGNDIVTDAMGEFQGRGKHIVTHGIGAFQARLMVTIDRKTNKSLFRFVEESDHLDQLLPGIPDEITLNQIVPKLQCRVFYILSLVSHSWQQAIQSYQVYDARVRSKSTETFVAIQSEEIYLYSVRDKYYYQLPEIPAPHLVKRESDSWHCIALDGKLYVLGGLNKIDNEYSSSREVYVLDLAGQRKWKQCASMKEGREHFGCGVLDGKIYVFGGYDTGSQHISGSEVYDPEDNSWSAISSEISWRWIPRVAALGEELFLYDGRAYDPEYGPVQAYNDDGSRKKRSQPPWFWDVYHPVRDEWKIVRPFLGENRKGTVFMSKGKFYMMTDDLDARMDVYDYDKNTWSHLQSSSFAVIAGTNDTSSLCDVVVVNDELLVDLCNFENQDTLVLRSNGFGSDKKDILWQTENGFIPFEEFLFLCTVQL